MDRYSHSIDIRSRTGGTRTVLVSKKVSPMNARTKMINELRGESRMQTEYQARCGAQEALHGARRQLRNFGPVGSYRDAVESKNFPTAAQRASAVKVAQAAANVETRTLELEAVLKDESAAVMRIERAQSELQNAQRTLEAALAARVRDQADLPKFDARAGRVLDADERRLWDRTFPKTAGRQ